MKRDEASGLVILVIIVLAAAITTSRALFPYFFLGIAITIGSLILTVIYHAFFDQWGDYGSWYAVLGGIGVLCLVGASVTFLIGYSFGNSPIGQAILDLDRTFNLVQEVKNNASAMQFDILQNTTSSMMQATNASPETQIAVNASIEAAKIANDLEQ